MSDADWTYVDIEDKGLDEVIALLGGCRLYKSDYRLKDSVVSFYQLSGFTETQFVVGRIQPFYLTKPTNERDYKNIDDLVAGLSTALLDRVTTPDEPNTRT